MKHVSKRQAEPFGDSTNTKSVNKKSKKKGKLNEGKLKPVGFNGELPSPIKGSKPTALAHAIQRSDLFSLVAPFCSAQDRLALKAVSKCTKNLVTQQMLARKEDNGFRMEILDNSTDAPAGLSLSQGSWEKHYTTKENFIKAVSYDEEWDEKDDRLISRTVELLLARGCADAVDFLKEDTGQPTQKVVIDLITDTEHMQEDDANPDIIDLTNVSDEESLNFKYDESDDEKSVTEVEDAVAGKGRQRNVIDHQASDDETECLLEDDDDEDDDFEGADDVEDDAKSRPDADLDDDAHFRRRCSLQDNEIYITDDSDGWNTKVTYETLCPRQAAVKKVRAIFEKVPGSHGDKTKMKLMLCCLLEKAKVVKFAHYKNHFRKKGEILSEWALFFDLGDENPNLIEDDKRIADKRENVYHLLCNQAKLDDN